MEDLNLIFQCVKYIGMCLILWFCTVTLSACGVKAGGFVAGSTSYLQEANRGLEIQLKAAPQREHTREEKRALARIIGGN